MSTDSDEGLRNLTQNTFRANVSSESSDDYFDNDSKCETTITPSYQPVVSDINEDDVFSNSDSELIAYSQRIEDGMTKKVSTVVEKMRFAVPFNDEEMESFQSKRYVSLVIPRLISSRLSNIGTIIS